MNTEDFFNAIHPNDDVLFVALPSKIHKRGYDPDWIEEVNVKENVFFTVNSVKGLTRKKEDVVAVNALFIDVDGRNKYDKEVGSVACGRSEDQFHIYWPLVEGESLEDWEKAQKALAVHFNADTACTDLPRLMRVPGTLNHKEHVAHEHELWRLDEEKRWTIQEVMDLYGLELKNYEIEKPKPISLDIECPDFIKEELLSELNSIEAPEGERRTIGRNWAVQAIGAGMDTEEVTDTLINKFCDWGMDLEEAKRDAHNATKGTAEKIMKGELKVDSRYRPDLVFTDEGKEVKTVEDPEKQRRELCGPTPLELVEEKGLDGIKELGTKIALLPELERTRIKEHVRDSKIMGIRAFNTHLKEMTSKVMREQEERILNSFEHGAFEAGDYQGLAEEFLKNHKPIKYFQGQFFIYENTHYQRLEEDKYISSLINKFLPKCGSLSKEGIDRIKPNINKIANVQQQVTLKSMLEKGDFPRWLDGKKRQTISFQNGMLVDGEFTEHTHEWFSETVLDFDYSPGVNCPLWHEKLKEWFESDGERIELLQMWMGYLLSGSTSQQKILVLNGASRGGKGTICHVIEKLLGRNNVSSPSMKDFSSEFGLAPSLGKTALMIRDAHMDKMNRMMILDRLKAISGDDPIQVNRKFLGQIDAKLGNIVMATNEMAELPDESGALMNRFSIIDFRVSFADNPDIHLKDKLDKELAGICNWALIGLDKLNKRGKFHKTKIGEETMQEWSKASSPIRAWVSDCVERDKESIVEKDKLWHSYEVWAGQNNVSIIDRNVFFKRVKTVILGLDDVRPRSNDGRAYAFKGVSLRQQSIFEPVEKDTAKI